MSGKFKILAVEDHELLLWAVRDILEDAGYEVITAGDGVEALERMAEVTPDLIIADILMPRMNGYELYEHIREHSEWVPIPFIFLTAKAEKEDRLKGKAMGVEDYIIKPFDPDELVVTVRSRLARSRAIRQANEGEFNELKQQIVTILSHELRTPLTNVYGYTELALEEAANMSTDEFPQFLEGIKKGADRLTRLVEEMLLVVRLDTGEAAREFDVLATARYDVRDIIFQAVEKYRDQAESRGLTLICDCPEQLPPVKLLDSFLTEIISQLLSNAIKFTRRRGKTISVVVTASEGQIRIAVRDEGVGIPAAQIGKLFDYFRQINREKMEQQGVGMGLKIARGLARCMGGDVEVESVLDKGSTFTLWLPVYAGESE